MALNAIRQREGWYRADRTRDFEPELVEDPMMFLLWHYILANAAYQTTTVVLNGERLIVGPGQLWGSLRAIGDYIHLPHRQVGRKLERLEKLGRIKLETDHRGHCITVSYWEQRYAPKDKGRDSERTSRSHRGHGLSHSLYYKNEEGGFNSNKGSESEDSCYSPFIDSDEMGNRETGQ